MNNTNSFLANLKAAASLDTTTNGAICRTITDSTVYNFFALGGALRNRSDIDFLNLFINAFNEDMNLALKCLFYLSDVREGQGERRLFRICYRYLCNEYPSIAMSLIKYIPEYTRWDNVIYACEGTFCEKEAFDLIKHQLVEDMNVDCPSLCAKWMPSENASSQETRRLATKLRKFIGLTSKQYRKMLSYLRNKIKVTERLMSDGRWDEIEFDKLPSKAGVKYSNTFSRREETSYRYSTFINSKKTKVNAATLYPYEIIEKLKKGSRNTATIAFCEKAWKALPDYIRWSNQKILCVCDTSGSMMGRPYDVASSLGIYCSERLTGAFKDKVVTFSNKPQFIDFTHCSTLERKIIKYNNYAEVANTNLEATFDLLLDVAKLPSTKVEDIPTTLLIISDMQIDAGITTSRGSLETTMEAIQRKWREADIPMPKLVYWNVNAVNNTILDTSEGVTCVSGCSPSIMKSVLTGKSGYDLMIDAITSDRYEPIHI